MVYGALDESAMSLAFKVAEIEIACSFADTLNEQVCPVYPDIKGFQPKTSINRSAMHNQI